MKNRVVRLIIYIVVGVAVGAGVAYYKKTKKMETGVVALTPDDVQVDTFLAPSREEIVAPVAMEKHAVKEAEHESVGVVLEQAKESLPARAGEPVDLPIKTIEEALEEAEIPAGE